MLKTKLEGTYFATELERLQQQEGVALQLKKRQTMVRPLQEIFDETEAIFYERQKEQAIFKPVKETDLDLNKFFQSTAAADSNFYHRIKKQSLRTSALNER